MNDLEKLIDMLKDFGLHEAKQGPGFRVHSHAGDIYVPGPSTPGDETHVWICGNEHAAAVFRFGPDGQFVGHEVVE